MIRNQWYAVLDAGEVKKGRLLGVTRLGERMVFWRDEKNEVVCLRDLCAHRGAKLSAGRHKGDHIACPFHGFEYDKSGRITYIPANGRATPVPEQFRVNAYPVRIVHDMVFIWWGDETETLPEPPRFPDIDDDFPHATSAHPWPVHYSRSIENQLDLVHLPFVHTDSIGRGGRTLVNGPVELVKEGQIEFWVYNDVDNGQKPKKAEDLPPPNETRQHLHFIFPNIWQNWITPKFRVFAAFVPVDEGNSIVYLRNYQRFVTLPVLRQIVDFIAMRFSVKILNQDYRVVVTQFPIKTALKMNEKLIQGDQPIITYRRIRDELQKRGMASSQAKDT